MEAFLQHQSQLVHLFSMLSKSVDKTHFMNSCQSLLISLKTSIMQETKPTIQQSHFVLLTTLYKLIPYTRDIYGGLGERDLTYLMLFIWKYQFPVPAAQCLHKMMLPHSDTLAPPFGSWRDIKYLCATIRSYSEKGEEDPFIETCVAMMNHQLDVDTKKWEKALDDYIRKQESSACLESVRPTPASVGISLVSKWIPREGSAFDWLFKRCVIQWIRTFHNYIFTSCKEKTQFDRALKKGAKIYRRVCSRLSKEWGTLEIKQCNGVWDAIQHTEIPMCAGLKQQNALLNIGLNGHIRTKTSRSDHRNACARKMTLHRVTNDAYKKHHLDKVNPVFVDLGWIVQAALRVKHEEEIVRLENMWNHMLAQLPSYGGSDGASDVSGGAGGAGGAGFSGFFPVVDLSLFYSNAPRFYEALGHACLVALAPHSSKSILFFDSTIHYIHLDTIAASSGGSSLRALIRLLKPLYYEHHIGQDFVEVCDTVLSAIHDSHMTNIMISQMKLCFFVDIAYTDVDVICRLFSQRFRQHAIDTLPRFLFWLSGRLQPVLSSGFVGNVVLEKDLLYGTYSGEKPALFLCGASNYIWTRIAHIPSHIWNVIHPFDFIQFLLNSPRYDTFGQYFSTLLSRPNTSHH